ncbi:bifunctional UDP-N-acetylmuramoyl-L-alanyl-D-glutamate--2,6-diaminopimelate ligase MurE/UDP-N-acetylmuramoyl-tripeptide--D-alanyl-D-alanine ligase MurF [Pusillimonas sp. MFBS29]|uniref:bifunctional UDP-N-acetylmuramoyl-L-alanyl-D-glutamate--2, 6-diaminopimelate ligase MurE/UDP-N-acetylmuramoyl-tripeptide--D-alanyl-D-alanine ligase MurF n=1 Tax=Pusillimonas sp. MFBS29 TaxID=2886690 RepID=UPI001D0FCA43|nr:bifunctional UDP-N-acetylmuramoyl-L-alanyl-D-glutamate--2,6-diaminopimelate ligase MurE/UDP-N-acetylmuramoyl-tripeptide--D-alanyl-D-alanine ligase MurF [Pusillimonas sp. MFBS29]MCC2597451.1 bifunctional UDP-N-acetylmuramoyl-L-alanyl-D-glutamate--2,6-diaminopimelate ligase MurE/UDP-N-acetylmuramoyl-tripeptide--D-alanyl-D-alanine ligase MurF [Pusillimonas sp. MFBS29]
MNAKDIISWLGQHVAPKANLCLDSRQLSANDVFFACKGHAGDGRDYISQAIQAGAAAIVMHAGDQQTAADSIGVPVLAVENLSGVLGQVADLWYGQPSGKLSIIAVTGTNGKTSCVQWLAAALNGEGTPCATLGTLGATLPDGSNLGGVLTTPDVLTMHRSLAAMLEAGAQVVALEASSIGLEQGRLDHVRIDIAAFTNLTHDHLDYHGTLENYRRAKFALFNWPGLSSAVVNIDDPAGRQLANQLPAATTLAYSVSGNEQAAIQAQDIHAGRYGLVFNLVTRKGAAQLLTRLVGEHNVANLLLVSGVLQQLGWDLSRIARVLATLRSVEGRLQVIEPLGLEAASHAQAMVIVDYAHTPDALERALIALGDVAKARGGKLICVFGCGGSRDRSKRPIMGRIAFDLADEVVLTNDNPRLEEPQDIIAQIVSGMPQAPRIEPDRALAILSSIWSADTRDVVLLAGKGHETYQEILDQRQPFDDREWARFALSWQQGISISTDSRSISQGQLFVALKGDAFDGHAYLSAVQEAGACAAVVERKDGTVALPQFVLGDTRQALIRISTMWRRQHELPVIAVTGSNGKTTTKEMIAAILREWPGEDLSLATRGNLNNDIGVPLTVMRLDRRHCAAVFELGMNHPGEIALLANIAQPTVALVNNAQREHQEFMLTVEAVARENGTVIDMLPADGVAVFPGDDVYSDLWSELAGDRKVLKFGFNPDLDVYADQIHAEPTRTVCRIHTPDGSAMLNLAAPGVHNLRNALAAAACALATGVPLDRIIQGLESFNPVSGRMQPRSLAGGYQLIDDTYNANPDSVRAAIDVLSALDGKRVLVLGDMGEVGVNGDAMHAEVGAYAKELGIDVLLAFGPACAHAANAFGDGAHAFQSIEALNSCLLSHVPAHILVKGSRSTRMERVVRALEQELINQEEGDRHAT